MVPPRGASTAEQWVGSGQRAAAIDLLVRIKAVSPPPALYLLVADRQDQDKFSKFGAEQVSLSQSAFHFGEALITFIEEHGPEVLLYFGAGSAPLLETVAIEHALQDVLKTESPSAMVNNLHSTDWAILNHPDRILLSVNRFPSDNQLGWVLSNDLDFDVVSSPLSPATMVDIDTPNDLLMIQRHPQIGPNLEEFYHRNQKPQNGKLDEIIAILKSEAKSLGLIGRSSAYVWGRLDEETKLWVRVFVEERGMVASGRLEDGVVRSLVAELLERMGADAFIQYLSDLVHAVLWDTRVWMAHRGGWPTRADRFAADLGWDAQGEDPTLRNLTRAIRNASIPILTGGHGVVAGNVLAILESL